MIPPGARVWIAMGHTDMRKGMQGLALMVQQGLKRNPHGGDLFVFRGRAGSLVKIIWHDGIGMSLYAKRLERGRFIWPSATDGIISLTPSQLACLLEGKPMYFTPDGAADIELCRQWVHGFWKATLFAPEPGWILPRTKGPSSLFSPLPCSSISMISTNSSRLRRSMIYAARTPNSSRVSCRHCASSRKSVPAKKPIRPGHPTRWAATSRALAAQAKNTNAAAASTENLSFAVLTGWVRLCGVSCI